MRYALLAGASALAMGFASTAFAAGGGNIVLTGHDNDYHDNYGPTYPTAVLGSEVNWARNGSSLPVLSIDAGSELTNSLTNAGISYVNFAPSAVTAGMFNHSVYSAFVVASVSTCGGCDNPVGTGAHLATFESSIASFYNAGGGIVGLTGANDPTAFSYVPESGGVTTAIFSSSGFVATPAGTAGIPGFGAVNGDQTHNTFSGFASFYHVAEVYNLSGGTTGPAVTIFGSGGTIGCTGTSCHITGGVPEPSTWAMVGLGFFGLGIAYSRKRKHAELPAVA